MILAGAAELAADESTLPGPAEAAVAHLKKIAARKVNLEVGGDTVISPHVGAAKRREIAGRIERMAFDVGDGELEAGEVRIDGTLAGVIVHKTAGYDPSKVAAFAQAMVFVDGKWKPAPVPASFENTGVMLDPALRRGATAIEQWMLRERALAHGRLEQELGNRMRKDIAGVMTREQLAAMSPGELGETFLKACIEKDRVRLLALLGGLSDPLPDDWGRRLQVAEEVAAGGGRLVDAWRGLTSRQVLRTVLGESGSDKRRSIQIGYIDPAAEVPRGGVPEVRMLEIHASRDAADLWRLDLPTRMLAMKAEPGFRGGGAADPDPDLQMRFAEQLRKSDPATPQSSPEALWERMRTMLAADSPEGLMRLLSLPADDPEAANQSLGRASRFWWQVAVANGGRHPVRLAFREAGDEAMVMMQLFAFREPDRTDLRALHFIRTAEGWLWNSTGRRLAEEKIHADLVAWRTEMEAEWRERWVDTLLKPVAAIEKLEPGRPVAAEAAVEHVRGLLAAIAAGDIETCLSRCAVLKDPDGQGRLLRNLGYELSTRLTDIEGDMVTRTGKHWTVVAYRRRDDVNPGMALLPIIHSPDGPRVLMELDLFVGTRQREFLNNAALERLDNYADDEVRADLRALLADLNREFGPARR
jgi:hypothetical protein